ncbi:structure-specific endonuclease subunit SLX4-like [Pomacea canaliculata]|uniref:structure-specific endonuclease subunit SLX4-like n=1 Tax=Pomacea canaliculata TaxID=400727 RepID=UPI000D73DC47|nr:structure-specific endonuclease subunit SLX4-like [Pomacea canaliculata]
MKCSESQDVNVFEEADDDDDVALSQQVSAADREQMIMNYIRGRSDLYEKVLTYEPLDLVVLKDDLKAASIRCGQQKLMDLLNAKCITFTNKNVGLLAKKHPREVEQEQEAQS